MEASSSLRSASFSAFLRAASAAFCSAAACFELSLAPFDHSASSALAAFLLFSVSFAAAAALRGSLVY